MSVPNNPCSPAAAGDRPDVDCLQLPPTFSTFPVCASAARRLDVGWERRSSVPGVSGRGHCHGRAAALCCAAAADAVAAADSCSFIHFKALH